MALYSTCNRCKSRVPYGTKYCNDCTITVKRERVKASKRTRNKEAESFYGSYKWQKKRQQIAKDNHYLCYVCKNFEKKYVRYNEVHHIKPLIGNFELALSDDNLICLCSEHHDMIHSENLLSKDQIREFFINSIKG